jgi:hypothetical protein
LNRLKSYLNNMTQDWKKEVFEHFELLRYEHSCCFNLEESTTFIEQLLASQKQQWIESVRKEIEGEKKVLYVGEEANERVNIKIKGWNYALDRVLILPSLTHQDT